ncbi:dermonecrotic toxin domain-containing protein [Pseudomonas sp. GL93]|uniref:dermonecrotic toxin domain-containing protein n=1 Tax=Pseudomonas sp. GL93 TaxID=2014741 RepID=UPI00105844BA|nr:DUF6543 domain-containing protein [Pseudomonas sp. GL93]
MSTIAPSTHEDIQALDHALITGLIKGQQNLMLDGKAAHCHDLSLMDATLTGVVLICADLEVSRQASPLIAYIPDDPQHPLKRYASTVEFMQALTGQLRQPDYQQFFSRFVGHPYQGHFFSQLGARLSQVKWHQHAPGDPQPSWRETPLNNPNLQFSVTRECLSSTSGATTCSIPVPRSSDRSNANMNRPVKASTICAWLKTLGPPMSNCHRSNKNRPPVPNSGSVCSTWQTR